MSDEKEFDVVFLGATGFTGQLLVEYVYNRYGLASDLKWAIAGRNQNKLESICRSSAFICVKREQFPLASVFSFCAGCRSPFGTGDWLGTGTIAPRLRQYRSFNAAREFARSLNLESGSEWRAFCKSGKLPPDIPANPHQAYKDKGWKGMRDWLGTNADE